MNQKITLTVGIAFMTTPVWATIAAMMVML